MYLIIQHDQYKIVDMKDLTNVTICRKKMKIYEIDEYFVGAMNASCFDDEKII